MAGWSSAKRILTAISWSFSPSRSSCSAQGNPRCYCIKCDFRVKQCSLLALLALFSLRHPMSTPARLVRLKCPNCAASHWVIDCDFPGEGTPWLDLPYEKRTYPCPHCCRDSAGHQVKEKSPPEFFVQPHELYPIAPQEFEKWLAILREHFPDNSMLADVGASTLIT
jgi:hypothetical protein